MNIFLSWLTELLSSRGRILGKSAILFFLIFAATVFAITFLAKISAEFSKVSIEIVKEASNLPVDVRPSVDALRSAAEQAIRNQTSINILVEKPLQFLTGDYNRFKYDPEIRRIAWTFVPWLLLLFLGYLGNNKEVDQTSYFHAIVGVLILQSLGLLIVPRFEQPWLDNSLPSVGLIAAIILSIAVAKKRKRRF
jgi:hypothetical protein